MRAVLFFCLPVSALLGTFGCSEDPSNVAVPPEYRPESPAQAGRPAANLPTEASGGAGRPLSASGTRLKARRLVGVDGSSALVGWRDTGRNENCSFAKASDGKWRCLPEGVNTVEVGTFFADPRCQTPVQVITVRAGCPVKYAVARSLSVACSTSSPLLYAVQANPATFFYMSGYTCQSAIDTLREGGQYHRIESEIAPAEFVEGTEQVDP